MNLMGSIKKHLYNLLELSRFDKQEELRKQKEKDLEDRILNIETRMVEMSRVLATIALAHASLLRELTHITDAVEKKKKTQQARKTEDDFTN